MISILLGLILIFSLNNNQVFCLDNGLGKTPQMGWNSWSQYKCKINQSIIIQNANFLVSSGLANLGYLYVSIDDCWQDIKRDSTGKLKWNSAFPSGMPSLIQYIHKKGLKFGIYSDIGEQTCQGRPGSFQYQDIDAKTFASWEVDFLKYDNCYNQSTSSKQRYPIMTKALNQSGRRIFYSICNRGKQDSYKWAFQYVNSWKTADDIQDKWTSFQTILDQQAGLSKYSGPGQWNDPGMLYIGNGGMSNNEYLTQFAMWCLLKAPLLLGNNILLMNNETLSTIKHQGLIAINQDQLGIQSQRISHQLYTNGWQDIWVGPLSNKKYVIGFLNRRTGNSTKMSVSLSKDLKFQCDFYRLKDVINRKDLGIISYKDIISVDKVLAHYIIVYTIECLDKQQNIQELSAKSKQQNNYDKKLKNLLLQ